MLEMAHSDVVDEMALASLSCSELLFVKNIKCSILKFEATSTENN